MTHELLLLRHGQVQSHRGDVPVTDEGLQLAHEVGTHLAARAAGRPIRVISGQTLRTRSTAEAVGRGASDAGAHVIDDGVAFALRNPDLYLAGVRVDMVSSEAAFAEQVPGVSESDVAAVEFYRQWLSAPDRVGWWVAHPHPPGDDAGDVVRRITRFAASLADRNEPSLVIGITHSPVLRALAVEATIRDPGEPAWLAGVQARVADDRTVSYEMVEAAP